MTTTREITEAIKDLVEGARPGEPVYIDQLPQGFKRPSTLIEQSGHEWTDANRLAVRVKAQFALTCFSETDAHHISDATALAEMLDATAALFARGYLRVGDRCLKAAATLGGVDFEGSYVDLQLDYFDDRPGEGGDEEPTGGALEHNITTKTEE